ncbi:short-subunit dehydrogenase [Glaciihabitans tibetensis]|uniref:Short-subunit dehydrogenase n=1 Tax=Glaciihabitans tibetensis TaxID=1266600 RepID=A0A2T0V747_9MICO|nr:SDR family NAD(P)-dependent oxidoreductase [Glaciihabitans tibetensis]PRY65971.1 short-subunit dehydrogenase [Glaciihabitans tibetensis]
MSNRTIVITGASDGIGAAAARALSAAGDRVVVVGRSPEKTQAVATELGADWLVADFARLDDVRTLAGDLLERYPRIDVLANNAGGIMGDRAVTEDGHERTFQINHLAPFLLTTLLRERLAEGNATVINTSSVANRLYGRLDLDDLDAESKYSPNLAYGNAKLANILFTKELDRRYGADGISTAAFHPGVVATSFSAGSTSMLRHVYQGVLGRFLLSPDKGADTLVWLATTTPGSDWERGGYYAKRKLAKMNPQASDAALAAQLWDRSAEMVGVVPA